jgi:S-DNA-T family DNA segregation ATPase FtsK/SpoIIIE
VGVVTNLNPLFVERALASIKTEFDRRQKYFESASVKDIWEYNATFPKNPLPHLLLVLDEFSIGMNDFPALPLILADLVRVGRALGMYLLLANQDVNPAVDRLLSNVGWRIALKLANQEDMHIIDRTRPKMEKTGRGYLLRSQSGDIFELQAAYAGFLMADPGEIVEDTFRIYQVDAPALEAMKFADTRNKTSSSLP